VRWLRWRWLWIAQIFASEWCLGLAAISVFTVAADIESPLDHGIEIAALGVCIFTSAVFIFEIFRFEAKGVAGPLKINWFKSAYLPRIKFRGTEFELKLMLESGEAQKALRLGDPFSAQPLIIVIHGGAWTFGDAAQFPATLSDLHERGFAVLALNYRKLPQHRWPTQISDVELTISEIISRRPDGAELWLYGRSAGGQLALLAAEKFKRMVSGVVAIYPVTDIKALYESGREKDILDTRALLRHLLGDQIRFDGKKQADASPTQRISAEFPKTLLVHGERDPVVPVGQSELLANRLKNLGVQFTEIRLSRATHSFDRHWNGPSSQVLRAELDRFLKPE
jgi:acetyl esterase/lipase